MVVSPGIGFIINNVARSIPESRALSVCPNQHTYELLIFLHCVVIFSFFSFNRLILTHFFNKKFTPLA